MGADAAPGSAREAAVEDAIALVEGATDAALPHTTIPSRATIREVLRATASITFSGPGGEELALQRRARFVMPPRDGGGGDWEVGQGAPAEADEGDDSLLPPPPPPDAATIARTEAAAEAAVISTARLLRLTDLSNFPPPPRPDGVIFTTATADQYVPRTPCTDALWKHLIRESWRGAALRPLAAGHVSAALFELGAFQSAVVDAVRRLRDGEGGLRGGGASFVGLAPRIAAGGAAAATAAATAATAVAPPLC
jgi:hypothetical protein